MKKKTIIVNLKIMEAREDGGRIRINTAAVDRDKDRVLPSGGRFDNYLKNPVVMWGHNYREPWALIGRTNQIEQTEEYIDVDFDLREPVGEGDPVRIVRSLWNNQLVKTASIGFMPLEGESRNDAGGIDFPVWDLLEWSLVPIPSNQEALRLAYKSCTGDLSEETEESDQEGEQTQEKATQSDFKADPDTEIEIDIDYPDWVETFANANQFINSETTSSNSRDLDIQKDEETEETEPNKDDPTHDASEVEEVKAFFEQLNQVLTGEFNNE